MDDDEDAFLYGDDPVQTAASRPSMPTTVDHDMEPASEEGEVEDDDEEEESGSVPDPLNTLMTRILNLLLRQNLGNGLHHHRMPFKCLEY